MRITALLPKRVTALPLKNMVSNCPMGKAQSMLASCASVKFIADLKPGMRLAQLIKHTPWQKKKTETAMRVCSLVYWGGKVAVAVFNDVL